MCFVIQLRRSRGKKTLCTGRGREGIEEQGEWREGGGDEGGGEGGVQVGRV